MPTIPDVSLITSWHVGWPDSRMEHLSGLKYGLSAGVRLFDLYFLNHDDIPWYLDILDGQTGSVPKTDGQRRCPLRFAASLTANEIKLIAERLLEKLIEDFQGRLVGTRPRFVALATYWPLIADNNPEMRELSIRAIRNSLILAGYLGCRHVEIVGGFSFSQNDGAEPDHKGRNRAEVAKEVRTARVRQLCQSLTQVFETKGDSARALEGVYLCMEAEPGSAFLIQDVAAFHEIHKALPKGIKARVLMNLDVAHMFLADASRPEGSLSQIEYIKKKKIKKLIGHFHLSDHARSHASDLCPGNYHFFEDYQPWLDLAIDLTDMPQFSNAMAVEMEACSDIHEVKRAIARTHSWLTELAAERVDFQFSELEGVLMAVDIVNSTKELAMEGLPERLGMASKKIDLAVSALCRRIQHHRGSVFSFTGDGVIAIFESRHFQSKSECMIEAVASAQSLFESMASELRKNGEWKGSLKKNLGLRVSISWGNAMMPEVGALKYQLLGGNVITTCRMLNVIARSESGILASRSIFEGIPETESADWSLLSEAVLSDREKFKGLNDITIDETIGDLYSVPQPKLSF